MFPTQGPNPPNPPIPPPPFVPGGVPVAARPRPRPWVAIGLIIAGFVVLVGGFIVAGGSTGPDDYPAVAVPGQRSIDLAAGSTYTLYFEYPGAQSQERNPPAVHVTGPTGDDEPLGPPDTVSTTYETISGGRQGRAFASMRPDLSGIYRIEVEAVAGGDPGDELQVTVGREESDNAVLLWATGVVLGLGLLVAGTVMLIVRAVRRRRALSPVGVDPSPVVAPPVAGWSPPDPSERAQE